MQPLRWRILRLAPASTRTRQGAIWEQIVALLWRAALRSGSAGTGCGVAREAFAAVARKAALAMDCDIEIAASPDFGGPAVAAGPGSSLSAVTDAAGMEREKAGFQVSSSVPSSTMDVLAVSQPGASHRGSEDGTAQSFVWRIPGSSLPCPSAAALAARDRSLGKGLAHGSGG